LDQRFEYLPDDGNYAFQTPPTLFFFEYSSSTLNKKCFSWEKKKDNLKKCSKSIKINEEINDIKLLFIFMDLFLDSGLFTSIDFQDLQHFFVVMSVLELLLVNSERLFSRIGYLLSPRRQLMGEQ
jgi:hypothetical protein